MSSKTIAVEDLVFIKCIRVVFIFELTLLSIQLTSDLRDAIELLLCSEVDDLKPGKGRDAVKLLQKGLAALAKAPHQALSIDIGANTQEIRKAYKKLALK